MSPVYVPSNATYCRNMVYLNKYKAKYYSTRKFII
jgi:hypothetical protein